MLKRNLISSFLITAGPDSRWYVTIKASRRASFESQPVTSQQLKKSIPPKMIDRKRPKGVELKNKRVTTDGRL